MPACRVSKSSPTLRRRVLARKILEEGAVAMVACSSCARAQALCIFSASSSKCAECTRKGMSCDGSFSEADYDRLSEEEARLETARQVALDRAQKESAEAASLNRRIVALRKAKGAMIAREAQLLQELDQETQPQQANAGSELVFDEQQLADLFGAPEGSGGDTPQVSQG
jgi:hypothetical protein